MNPRLRSAIRYGIVLIGGFIAGSRLVGAVQAWHQWRIWRESDPSGADAYLTFAEVDSVIAVVSLVLAVLLWRLLRPQP